MKTLQGYLRKIGYPLKLDGIFKSKTKAAVINMQKRNGRKGNGVVNKDIYNLIRRVAAKKK